MTQKEKKKQFRNSREDLINLAAPFVSTYAVFCPLDQFIVLLDHLCGGVTRPNTGKYHPEGLQMHMDQTF